MKSERLDATMAIRAIQNLVNDLLNLFLYCKSRKDEVAKLKSNVDELDEMNPEYHEILKDSRENTRMNFRFIILILSFFIDFFLLYEALLILCDQFGWPRILKYLIPAILIVLEVSISYFSIVQSRDEERSSRLSRKLQYFVLPILVGFSALAVFYHIESYNPEIDGISLIGFLTFRLLIQIVLLISSLMLHLWLIKNAEEMAEALAYLRYKSARRNLTSRINHIEDSNTSEYYPRFTKLSHKYVNDTGAFKRRFPDMNMDFASAMPQELIDGINTVMGRIIIGATNTNSA